MSYAFKQTSGWVKTGLMAMLNSAAFMMFLGLIGLMAILAMMEVINARPDLLKEVGTDVSREKFENFGVTFLVLMMIGLLDCLQCQLGSTGFSISGRRKY